MMSDEETKRAKKSCEKCCPSVHDGENSTTMPSEMPASLMSTESPVLSNKGSRSMAALRGCST